MFKLALRWPASCAVLFLACFLLSTAPAARAQFTGVDNAFATPVEGAGHDYIHFLSETVDPQTGSVNLHIQLPTPQGRGMTVPFSINYNSASVDHLAEGMPGYVLWAPNLGSLSQGGWSFGIPSAGAVTLDRTEASSVNTSTWTCHVTSNYIFRDAAGASHGLGLLIANANSGPTGTIRDCAEQPVTTSGDSQFTTTISWPGAGQCSTSWCPTPPNAASPTTITSNDGTVYHWGGGIPTSYYPGAFNPHEDMSPPDYIEDRNGNRITTWYSPTSSTSTFQFKFIDTLKRTVIYSNGFGPSGATNTISFGDIPYQVNYQVTWKPTSANYTSPSQYVGQTAISSSVPGNSGIGPWYCLGQGGPPGSIPPNNLTQTVVSQITLPNNRAYAFYYGNDVTPHGAPTNNFGLLSEIDYPSGAWVKYTWGYPSTWNAIAIWPGNHLTAGGVFSSCPTGPDGQPCSSAYPADGCQYQYMTPVVVSRQVGYGNGSSPALTQTYNYATTWAAVNPTYAGSTSITQLSTTVSETDNVTGKSSTAVYGYHGDETVAYYDSGSNVPIRTTDKAWAAYPYALGCEVDTLDNGLTSGVWYQYLAGTDLVTDKREYDYGLLNPDICALGVSQGPPSAVPTRETATNYQTFPTTPAGGNLYDRPASVITYDHGTRVAETDYTYDQGSTSSPPSGPVVQHDDQHYPAGSGVARGNVTTKTRLCFGGNPACTVNSTTTYAYDLTGQVVSSTDACGNGSCPDMPGTSNHTTTYSYADSYTELSGGTNIGFTPPNGNTNAFLTAITNPLGQASSFTYDWNNSQLTSSRDPNDIQNGRAGTTYVYNDPLWRPTRVTEPDGGVTTVGYNDAPYNSSANTPNVTSTKTMNSSQNLVTVSATDGVGHVVRTMVTSDPQGTDTTATVYDGHGRVYQQYNPTRCNPPTSNCGESTWGVTTYNYDALGRTIQMIPPDGSTTSNNVTTIYAGNTTLVTDQTGRQRRSVTDGLGRLIEVDEPAPQFTFTPTRGFASVLVGGVEHQMYGTLSSATVTVSGSEQSVYTDPCHNPYGPGTCPMTMYDQGGVTLTVNGVTVTYGYGSWDTPQTVAQGLAGMITASTAPVTGAVNPGGNTVTLTARTPGAFTYSFSSSSYSDYPQDFSWPSFKVSPSSGTVSGGSNNGTTPDTGTVSVMGTSVPYGGGDTPASVTSRLASTMTAGNPSVTAAASGTTLTLTARVSGDSTDYLVTCSVASNYPSYFFGPLLSFWLTCPPSLLGGDSDGAVNPSTEMVTQYAYDGLNNLTRVDQWGGQVGNAGDRARTFTYDSLSRLTSSTNPESGTIGYSYDANGNVVAKTDARNITTSYTYDSLDRLTQKSYNDGRTPIVTYGYDTVPPSGCTLPSLTIDNGIGKRTGMCDAAGGEAWSYDITPNTGWKTTDVRVIAGITKTAIYQLDLAGNNVQAVYPTGRVVNYTFDLAGRPSTATDSANGITYASGACANGGVCYAPTGAYSTLSIGKTASFTGLNLTHTYNTRLQPKEFSTSSTGGSAMDITYNFVDPVTQGNDGQVYGITNNLNFNRSQMFSYDTLNRLIGAGTVVKSSANCWGYQYAYDAWGNLLTPGSADPNYSGCKELQTAQISVNAQNRVTTFGYDAAGNTTSDTVNSYTYDAESEMTSAAGVGYVYDGDGGRVAKLGAGGQPTKIYWYGSGGSILGETDASGNVTEYIYFGGQRIAMLPPSGAPQYYVEDMLGSSRVVTTNTGVVCYDGDFYPYGGESAITNNCPAANKYKFEGKERDDESGNDDFGARYYSWRFGRWLSADWSAVPAPVPYANFTNPQTLNLYAMVHDDPETFADLDGHDDLKYAINDIIYGYRGLQGTSPDGLCDHPDTGCSTIPENNPHPTPPGQPKNPSIQNPDQQSPAQQGAAEQQNKPAQNQNQTQQNQQALVIVPTPQKPVRLGDSALYEDVVYTVASMDSKGNITPVKSDNLKVELDEKLVGGNPKTLICNPGQCTSKGSLRDTMAVSASGGGHSVEKRFQVGGKATRIYDSGTRRAYDFVRVDASVKKGFVFSYGNDSN